ncbi:MAG: hypothetical protein WEC34_12970 [Acidimicrobiia bacterium]
MIDDDARARARLAVAADTILTGVAAHLPAYLVAEAARVLDAWGRVPSDERERVDADLAVASDGATARVVADLDELFARDPVEQRATPFEVVRGSVREPTELLRAVGVPPVVRDEFEERAWPGDHYGLTPRAPSDLGGGELGPALLAWGLAKAAVLRGRAEEL